MLNSVGPLLTHLIHVVTRYLLICKNKIRLKRRISVCSLDIHDDTSDSISFNKEKLKSALLNLIFLVYK